MAQNVVEVSNVVATVVETPVHSMEDVIDGDLFLVLINVARGPITQKGYVINTK